MSGASCCSNPPTLDPTSGVGHLETVAGLTTYVTGSPHSNRAILFASDIFGFEAPKFRKFADKIAAAGFYVVVPDFFYGDPFIGDPLGPADAVGSLPNWLKNHGVDKGLEDAKLVIEALKSKGVTAIGAAGFCWGAKVVVDLAKKDILKAGVMLHPAFVTLDDIKEVKTPLSVLAAEFDPVTPPELARQFEEVLAAKSDELGGYYFKIFPKVAHGWTVRPSAEEEAAAEEAHEKTLDWLIKYVK